MENDKGQLTKTTYVAVTISAILIIVIVLQHNLAFGKTSTIVLPAGGTYLGPSPTPSPNLQGETLEPQFSKSGFATIKGRKYPYSFEIPKSVKLVSLGGAFDIYALSINDQPPDQNVLIGVDDLNRTADLKKYIKGSKRTYVENWWKQFSVLKGVTSITEFTNSKGLKGYKAKYINGSDVDIFFEVPDNRYVIHLANGPLDKKVFDAIVDSVAWERE